MIPTNRTGELLLVINDRNIAEGNNSLFITIAELREFESKGYQPEHFISVLKIKQDSEQ